MAEREAGHSRGGRSVALPCLQELDVRKPLLGHLQVDPVGGEVNVVAVAVEGGFVGEGAQVGVA